MRFCKNQHWGYLLVQMRNIFMLHFELSSISVIPAERRISNESRYDEMECEDWSKTIKIDCPKKYHR